MIEPSENPVSGTGRQKVSSNVRAGDGRVVLAPVGWGLPNKKIGEQLVLKEARKGFRMKKDYNTVIPMRKAMFRHLNKAIIVEFFKGVCNAVT